MVKWEASVYDLILGMISLFVAVGIILWEYSYLSGLASVPERHIILQNLEGLVFQMFVILFFSLMGGFEIGRYVQFTKRTS